MVNNVPILRTKLNRPKCFQIYFERTHLHKKLDDGLHLPSTLISAGAGFGKSTLVSEWLENISYKYTWLSCDENLDQLQVFISYLVEGICKSAQLEFKNTRSFFGKYK